MRATVALSLLIGLASSASIAWSVERNWCGVYGHSEATIDPSKPLVKALAIFVAFQPYTNTPLPPWASDLDGDFSQYLRTMSGNVQDMDVKLAKRPGADSTLAWMAPHEASYYNSENSFETSTGNVNYSVVHQVYTTDPSLFDEIEVVFIIHFECTVHFKCETDDVDTASPDLGGWSIQDYLERPEVGAAMVQMETIPGKNVAEFGLMHEYLHKVGPDHPPEAANYGRYDMMSGTQDGLAVLPEGLVPVHPFELTRDAGWAPHPVTISSSTLDVEVPDFFGTSTQSMRKTYQINLVSPPETIQSFFLVNHQGTTPFDSKYSGTGLLIWHFLESADAGARDLEVASGKFNPYPEGPADPASGEDALEASTSYLGSAADFFDGVLKTNFTYTTNPSTDLYTGSDYDDDPQNVPSGVGIENIRQEANGQVKVDIYLTKAQLIESPGAPNEAAIVRGSTVQINWRVRPLLNATTVDIEIAESGTDPFRLLASGLPNTGIFDWLVLQKEGSDYRLKLITRGPGGAPQILGTDTSDNPIRIDDNRSCPPQ